MTTYAIAQIYAEDKGKLMQYREKASEALAMHGGAIVTGGPVAEVLEAKIDIPDVAALLSFPSKEAAIAWKNDPELADVHALRNQGGRSTIYLLS